MKKTASLLLALLMLIGFAACKTNSEPSSSESKQESGSSSSSEPVDSSSEEDSSSAGSAIDFDEEPYNLVVCYPVLAEAQSDLLLIQDAINEITLREINATVEFEAVGLFSMANVYALKASSQEKVDLMVLMPGYSYLPGFAGSNMIQPIGDVIDEWGPSIKEVVGDILNAGMFNGEQYAIPENGDVYALNYGFYLSVPLCEKHSIDIEAVKTLEDLEAAFEIIKTNEPEITVLAPEQTGGNIAMSLIGKIDGLGTAVGALEVEGDGSLKAVSSAAREEYMNACIKVREWYEKGYISKDVTTAQESGSQMLWAGKVFATAAPSLGPSNGGVGNGIEFRGVLPIQSMHVTGDDQLVLWSVPTSCKRPDKAVQFINLAFGSEEITNLFRFGIEGNHYEILADGSAELKNTSGWQNNWNILGDFDKMYTRSDALLTAGISLDEYIASYKEWNDKTVNSPAYGFTFDPAPVKTEVAACDQVNDEFGRSIGNGTVDPVTEIPKYVERLNEAGIETILAEVQSQLDNWLSQQG